MQTAIALIAHDPTWSRAFREESQRLGNALRIAEPMLQHIGSTAIPGIAAKPVIDMMLGVPDLEEARERTVSHSDAQATPLSRHF